jgi:hypothetical protein
MPRPLPCDPPSWSPERRSPPGLIALGTQVAESRADVETRLARLEASLVARHLGVTVTDFLRERDTLPGPVLHD